MRLCYKSKCPFERRMIINCDAGELDNVVKWAINNCDQEYALGALAILNYLRGYDDRTPAERFGDRDGILQHSIHGDWLKLYIEAHGLPELSQTECHFREKKNCQWSGDD